LLFRVNPDVSPKTHPKYHRTSDFKIRIPSEEVVKRLSRGIGTSWDLHLSEYTAISVSQILDASSFTEAAIKMMELVEKVTDLGINLKFVDMGSGLGIPYKKDEGQAPTPHDMPNAILPVFNERTKAIGISPKLILEPGVL